MGQKSNPIGLRLGITEPWRSRWYADKKDFGKYLIQDQRIRKFVRSRHRVGISRIEIERVGGEMTVHIRTSHPGLIIGKRGANVEELTTEMQKLSGGRVELKVSEVEKPELDAALVAEGVAEQLRKRSPYRRTIRKVAEASRSAGAKGVKIQVSGRLGGMEIARSETIHLGSIPLHTLRAEIDYGFAVSVLQKGTVGVKVWIYKGEQPLEVSPRRARVAVRPRELSYAGNAQEGQVPQVPAGQDPGQRPEG